MISSSAKARFSLIFSMLVFAAVGPIVRHIPLPESVIAFCRALLGGFFFSLPASKKRNCAGITCGSENTGSFAAALPWGLTGFFSLRLLPARA